MFAKFFIRSLKSARFCKRFVNTDRNAQNKFEAPVRVSVLTQEGQSIHELPSIIQKTRDISHLCSSEENSKDREKKSAKVTAREIGTRKKRIDIETAEGTAILFGSQTDFFRNSENDENPDDESCKSESRGVGPVIETMITDEINSRVALEALKEIMALESSEGYRRSKRSKLSTCDGRERVFTQLMEMIVKSRETEMIIEGLSLLQKDRISSPKNPYRDRLADEILIRATNGDINLRQLIKSVKILSSYEDPNYRETADALWIGIKIRQEDISEENIVSLFKIVSHFDRSRKIVKSILEAKLTIKWWKLNGTQMAEILKIFQDKSFDSAIALICARKWITLHAKTAEETELFEFMNILIKIESPEAPIEKALTKYMESKGLRTDDPSLMALMMNYCVKNRIRNPRILAICEKYLIKRAMDLPASLLAPLFVPFGYLNYRPTITENFWTKFESVLESKFSYLETHDALNILLSMIYLERSPVNFVDEVFTPKFLGKLHAKGDNATIENLREKLRLLDAAMSIEDESYSCRMVPEDKSEKRVSMKPRIRRITKLIYRSLASIFGGEDKIGKNVILGRLPMIDLYTLDLFVYSSPVKKSIFRLNGTNAENIGTALLIHLPEHYCRDASQLIGPQEMRIRHLRKLGFRVMTLNYTTILRLRTRNDEMRDYLIERLRASEDL